MRMHIAARTDRSMKEQFRCNDAARSNFQCDLLSSCHPSQTCARHFLYRLNLVEESVLRVSLSATTVD